MKSIPRLFIYLIIFILASILNFIIVKYTSEQIFKFSTIGLIIIFIISLCVLFIVNKQRYLESFFAVLSITLFLFIFNVFFPVFIDRSVSYHIVLNASKQPLISSKIEHSEYTKEMYNARFSELSKLGLIQIKNDEITVTKFGKLFSNIMLFMGGEKLLNKTNGYYNLMINNQ